jgi:hypothetical protein
MKTKTNTNVVSITAGAATTACLQSVADEYGTLCAQMAALKARQAELKATLVAAGVPAVEGSLFRVTVSTGIAETLDMVAVRAKLSPQFITAHTIKTERTTVRCSARNNRTLAA